MSKNPVDLQQPIQPPAEVVADDSRRTEEGRPLLLFVRKNWLFIAAVCALLTVGIGLAVMMMRSNTDAVNPYRSQPVTTADVSRQGEQRTISYSLESLPGVQFSPPQGWLVEEFADPSRTIRMLSPDAESVTTGYESLMKGVSITVSMSARDNTIEAGLAEPYRAYVSQVGAPRVDNSPEGFNSETDWSAFKKFTNSHGVSFVSYEWGYEGCFLDTVFLSDTNAYHLIIERGGSCPDLTLLDASQDLRDFLDSVRWQDDARITANVIVKSVPSKSEDKQAEVHAKNVAFTFDSIGGDSLRIFDYYRALRADVTADGVLSKLFIGPSAETTRNEYDCEGCGAMYLAYDGSISVKPSFDTTGFTQLNESLWGKRTDVAPVQADGRMKAYQYDYIKMLDTVQLLVHFTFESMEHESLPPVDGSQIVNSFTQYTEL